LTHLKREEIDFLTQMMAAIMWNTTDQDLITSVLSDKEYKQFDKIIRKMDPEYILTETTIEED
jgi:hypothetical protein